MLQAENVGIVFLVKDEIPSKNGVTYETYQEYSVRVTQYLAQLEESGWNILQVQAIVNPTSDYQTIAEFVTAITYGLRDGEVEEDPSS